MNTLALVILLTASPRIEVAVAEAVVYVAQTQHPDLPDDFAKPAGPRGLRMEIAGRPFAMVTQREATIFTAEAVYGDGWCSNCTSLGKKWGSGNESVRIVTSREIAPGHQSYPAVRWMGRNGKWQQPINDRKQVVVPDSLDDLVKWIDSTNPPTDQGDHVAASPNTSAGSIYGREVIRSALARWREIVGSGKAGFTWTRNGSQTLPMLRLKEWTARAIYGTSGSFNLNVTGAPHSLPVSDALIDYRLAGDQLRLRGETSIDASLLGIDDASTKAVANAQPVGISPMLILSGLSMLWQLLNPQMDVQLPGEIAATAQMVGDELIVTFTNAPRVKIVMLFSFNLRVESVSISESKVVAKFSGSRWITQKTFEVK